MFDSMRSTVQNGASPFAPLAMRALALSGELSIPALRALSPLQDKAQVLIDRAVVEVGLERLVFAADLLAENLVYSLPDPLSVTQLEWDQESKTGTAQRTMSPSARAENQLVDRKHNRLPIYLTCDDFSLGVRTLKMSERVGTPLDVTMIKQATRRVNESIEDAALFGATTIDGQTLTVNTYTAPGLLTAPNANTLTLSQDWTSTTNTVGTTGPNMINDVLAMITKLQAAKKFGPYNLYIGTNAGNLIEGDFKVNTTDTIRERLERIQAGGRTLNIRVADRMPNASTGQQIAMCQMTDDVVQIVNGQAPTVIPWTSLDGFTFYWLVMAIMIPRVRSDYDGNSGVCIGSH